MRIRSLLIAVIFSISAALPFTIKTEKAFAEAEYAIELSIETIELPRNWIIEPNYKVNIPLRVSNNPGITYLSFLVKQSDNTPGILSAKYNKGLIPFEGVGSSYWPGFTNGARITTRGKGAYYDANDIFCHISINIPNDADYGDFFSVDFVPECMEDGDEFSFKKDGILYTVENFGKLTGGGVRIVDDAPLYAVETDYSSGSFATGHLWRDFLSRY